MSAAVLGVRTDSQWFHIQEMVCCLRRLLLVLWPIPDYDAWCKLGLKLNVCASAAYMKSFKNSSW